MTVTQETAVVYRGGGRRWFTLDAACRAEARSALLKRSRDRFWYDNRGGDDFLVIPESWLGRGRRLLTLWHKAAFKRSRVDDRAAQAPQEGHSDV